MALDDVTVALKHAPPHRFSDWPNPDVPPIAAGIYTVWDGDELIYVGMAGRSLTAETIAEYRAQSGG